MTNYRSVSQRQVCKAGARNPCSLERLESGIRDEMWESGDAKKRRTELRGSKRTAQ